LRRYSAIIADDEAALRTWLKHRLAEAWPELALLGEAAHGGQALELIQRLRPDIAFLDIRMPGLSGMEVAARRGTDCHIVFVSAYDQYAVEAFEKAAVDYLLKPVTPARLAQCVQRLRQRLAQPAKAAPDVAALLEALVQRTAPAAGPAWLRWIRASQGEILHLIPAADVCFFQARDKYTAVVTKEGEFLIRKPVRELAAELDPQLFWRIHRATIVNAAHIEAVSRSLTGRCVLRIKGVREVLTVSRSYRHLFRQM
jgi:DNA-binding LytR/AlgR family response regulator